MASLHLPSLAASAALFLLSVLAVALLAVTLYILGVVASFAVFCAREFARRDRDRPPLVGTVFRQLSGSFSYSIMKDLFGDGIFATDGEKWRQQRKLASHEFSTKVLREFSSVVFRTNATKLADKISSTANNGTVIDMQDLLMKTTMDSIFKVGFGFELNTLSGSDESSIQFSNAFDEANSLVFHRYVDIFWQLKSKTLSLWCMQRAREDILSRFIMQSKTDPKTMNDRYLRDIVLNFLIAGKDTTGNTLTWFFYMLCKNPIVQHKVELEINESVEWAEKDNADDFTARLNEGAIENMHYLHSAISETLRLYPAVPVDGKMADEDDVLPNGYRAGPHICLGKEFAYRQMKIMAATLIHFFRFKLADESKDATYKTMFTLHMDKGLHLHAYPRST
nr:unnamed protein product [Digitaria exilis]